MCRVELEAEIRLQVDELMREELKNLKLVGCCKCGDILIHAAGICTVFVCGIMMLVALQLLCTYSYS